MDGEQAGTDALWKVPVTYGAIGATKAFDLLTHPPHGYRPFERRARIGHGDARFRHAWHEALSWGVQRRSGFRVELAETPAEVTQGTYSPVSFDDDGMPVPQALAEDSTFGPDGTAFAAPGDSAWLVLPVVGRFGVRSPVRVVYVVDEPLCKGFAYGTLPGHPEDGEESFVVDQRDDGSVWLTIRAFSRPSSRRWWLLYPVLRVMQEIYTRRYLRALAGPID